MGYGQELNSTSTISSINHLLNVKEAKKHHNYYNREDVYLIIEQYKNLLISKYLVIYIELPLINITTSVCLNDNAVTLLDFVRLFLFNFTSFILVQNGAMICFLSYFLIQNFLFCIYHIINFIVAFLYLHFVINAENK